MEFLARVVNQGAERENCDAGPLPTFAPWFDASDSSKEIGKLVDIGLQIRRVGAQELLGADARIYSVTAAWQVVDRVAAKCTRRWTRRGAWLPIAGGFQVPGSG